MYEPLDPNQFCKMCGKKLILTHRKKGYMNTYKCNRCNVINLDERDQARANQHR